MRYLTISRTEKSILRRNIIVYYTSRKFSKSLKKGPDQVLKPTFFADWAYVLSNWANCITAAKANHLEKGIEITSDMSREIVQ